MATGLNRMYLRFEHVREDWRVKLKGSWEPDPSREESLEAAPRLLFFFLPFPEPVCEGGE